MSGDKSPNEITRLCQNSFYRLLGELVSSGYVERVWSDGRTSSNTLTNKGREYITAALAWRRERAPEVKA